MDGGIGVGEWMEEQSNEWMGHSMRWEKGWMNEWMDGRIGVVNGWMNIKGEWMGG